MHTYIAWQTHTHTTSLGIQTKSNSSDLKVLGTSVGLCMLQSFVYLKNKVTFNIYTIYSKDSRHTHSSTRITIPYT